MVSKVPKSLKNSARRFIKSIKYGEPKSDDYMCFLDLFVDAAVTYADMLKTLSEIEL